MINEMKCREGAAGLLAICRNAALAFGVLLAGCAPVFAAPADPGSSSFHDAKSLQNWTILRGESGGESALQAKDSKILELKTTAPVSLPVEATFHFRATPGDSVTFLALGATKDEKPLLECTFALTGTNQATITAKSSGEPMATTLPSTGVTRLGQKKLLGAGVLQYGWRFPVIRNLWDENDRKEIGAAYAGLVPFDQKIFSMRLVLTPASRQIWLDDRLVAEQRIEGPEEAQFAIRLSKAAKVLSADFKPVTSENRFLVLKLGDYSHSKNAHKSESRLEALDSVPMLVAKSSGPDIDLGDSLYRYRLTHATGPDAPSVNALCNWRGAFVIDPASFEFRVPFRDYQNVWLLAWQDDKPNSVAKGALRFFRHHAGYPASTEFEISDEAIREGLVKKLGQKTPEGHQLYLIKVPVNTDGLYGYGDLAGRFMDFELSKPTALIRSYPDPIYYGDHPSGLPSSIHVAGITLETAPFSYEVKPLQYSHVFERPERPAYAVSLTNTSDQPLDAKVTLRSKSYDGQEEKTVTGGAQIGPGKTAEVKLMFDLKKNGWHEMKAGIEAGGVKRETTLSLLLLPPNTRTYGDAANEIRFGLWGLWQHYTPLPDDAQLAMLRKLGFRSIDLVPYFEDMLTASMLKKYDFLPSGFHSINGILQSVNENDPQAMKEMVEKEVEHIGYLAKDFEAPVYLFGAEWSVSKWVDHAPWPLYTGDGDRDLTGEEKEKVERYMKFILPSAKAIREKYPKVRLVLQWGAPNNTLAYLREGFPKDLADAFGMDAPQFELLPEISNMTGSINSLWQFRAEAKRLGWPRLPIHWIEGPFFPTNPGALTETEQAEYQIRYWLIALAYGVDRFEAGVVPYDAGNFYGAEHYGAGVFHRMPYMNPKPAVAAIATATSMLCGADPLGGIDTGCLTTYCMAFERAKNQEKIFAIWRAVGKVEATLKVHGKEAVLTDAMGNTTRLPVRDGTIRVPVSSSPVWLTGVDKIEGFEFGTPTYETAPAKITRPLADMTPEQWVYDGTEDKAYTDHHFAVRRIPDPNLKAEFGMGENGHADAVAITLPEEPGDRPLANRYGALKLIKPVTIPGKARALGLWIKGNSSWGRIVYQLRDAKGEIWTSNGTKDDWNCDDPHGWSYVGFEGWKYVRFPLPGNKPYDSARDLDSTWWGSSDGDGIVDLPLTMEKIFVEARNEVPYLSEMKMVTDRSYKLSGLLAEYDTGEDASPKAVAQSEVRKPLPDWNGLIENPIAELVARGVGTAPEIKAVEEPPHWNDGRRMHIRFDQNKELKYNLYLSRYPDGRGAELLQANTEDNKVVRGFRPEVQLYLFLTSVSPDKIESKPSKAFPLITHDNFREK